MKNLILTTLILLSASSLVVAKSNDESLCGERDVEVASCLLPGKGRRVVSICANEKNSGVAYYFGTKNKIEFRVNFSSQRKLYRWQDKETYVVFFGFNKNGYSYVFGVPQETLGARAFLLKKKSEDLLDFSAPKFCVSNSFGNKNLISVAIGDVSDSAVRDKEFAFPPN